jgi:hypothetical protein
MPSNAQLVAEKEETSSPLLTAMSSMRDSADEEEENGVGPAFTDSQLNQLVAIIDSAMDRGAQRAKVLSTQLEESIEMNLSSASSFGLLTALGQSYAEKPSE